MALTSNSLYLLACFLVVIILSVLVTYCATKLSNADTASTCESKTHTVCKPSLTTVSGTLKPSTLCSGQLIFSDDFDTFNLQTWQHENTLAGGGNSEFQWYTNNRTNSFVENGHLCIIPTLLSDRFGEKFVTSGVLDINGGSPADMCTNPASFGCLRTGAAESVLNPIISARIRTVDSFNFKYGRVAVRAKTAAGDWLWPAIWFLPRYNTYGGWPASGEIDLLEARGNRNLTLKGRNIGVNLVTTTLHFGPDYFHNGYKNAQFHKEVNKTGERYNEKFHLYNMHWTPDFIKFYYDGEEVGSISPNASGFWGVGGFNNTVYNPWIGGTKMAPFDQEFYMVINLAVGGINFFPDEAVNTPKKKPWKNKSGKAMTEFWNARDDWLPTWKLGNTSRTAALEIDYIRIHAL